MGSNELLERILDDRVIAVLRLDERDRVDDIVDAIVAGGISIIEVTLTTPGAFEAIARLARRPELVVGAGTVLDERLLPLLAQAGARFVASPVYDAAFIHATREAGLVSMPGAATPTEIFRAWRDGADIVKLFPAPPDTAAWLRALRGPLPDVRVAPSGGVNAGSAAALLEAGAAALNVGTWLTHGTDGRTDSADAVTARAAALRAAVDIVHRYNERFPG